MVSLRVQSREEKQTGLSWASRNSDSPRILLNIHECTFQPPEIRLVEVVVLGDQQISQTAAPLCGELRLKLPDKLIDTRRVDTPMVHKDIGERMIARFPVRHESTE